MISDSDCPLGDDELFCERNTSNMYGLDWKGKRSLTEEFLCQLDETKKPAVKYFSLHNFPDYGHSTTSNKHQPSRAFYLMLHHWLLSLSYILHPPHGRQDGDATVDWTSVFVTNSNASVLPATTETYASIRINVSVSLCRSTVMWR